MKALDITHLEKQPDTYALFGDDGHVYIARHGQPPASMAQLPNIAADKEIKLYVHEPWVCVTERFGTRAALVHMESGSVRELCRGDYHANVSSYSIGFLEREGRVLLIHQTEWNRLDIMDAATGECLTGREVYYRQIKPWYSEENEAWITPADEIKNYLDYFHSLLHVSPDGAHFLSNGWIWHPIGQIICFHTDDFFKRYEYSHIPLAYSSDYNWDSPCTFIGHDKFVVAVDDPQKNWLSDREDRVGYPYKQLQFYCLSTPAEEIESGITVVKKSTPAEKTQLGLSVLKKERDAFCTAFMPDEDGRVHGELAWDAAYETIAAITPEGAFAIHLNGNVLEMISECRCKAEKTYKGTVSSENLDIGWHYYPQRHLLYHWSQEAEEIETRRFDCMKDENRRIHSDQG